MVKTKVVTILIFFALSLPRALGQDFVLNWSKHAMDGSRTGCVCATAENAAQAIGVVDSTGYVSPSGRVFTGGTTPEVASIVLEAQPAMADMKKVIAYSTHEMVKNYPESDLSNFFVDMLMKGVGELTQKKIDVGIANFGGIRVDMPKGDVLLDDIRSMFPFRNTLVYLELKGSDLLDIFSWMAQTGFQVLGGVEIVAEDGKIAVAKIGGEPVDPQRSYSVATISFLLNGGDGLYLAKNAENVQNFPVYIYDWVLGYVMNETAHGRALEYRADGRVKIL